MDTDGRSHGPATDNLSNLNKSTSQSQLHNNNNSKITINQAYLSSSTDTGEDDKDVVVVFDGEADSPKIPPPLQSIPVGRTESSPMVTSPSVASNSTLEVLDEEVSASTRL